MKNYIQPGKVVTLTAPTCGVVSGNGYLIGTLFVVAAASVAQGLPFEGMVEEVFSLPKATGVNWVEGAALYWDNTAKVVTNVSTSNKLIGAALNARINADTVCIVRLNGVNVP